MAKLYSYCLQTHCVLQTELNLSSSHNSRRHQTNLIDTCSMAYIDHFGHLREA